MKRISHLQALTALTVFAIVLCVSLMALVSSPEPALAGNLTSSSGSYPSQNVSRTVTLKNLRVGLDKLKSYRVRSSWTFDGKLANGKSYTQSYTIVESAFPSDKKFYRVVTLTQAPQKPSDAPSLTLESFEIAGVTYVSSTFGGQKATCESLPMPGGLPGGGGLFGLAGDVQSVRGARLIKLGIASTASWPINTPWMRNPSSRVASSRPRAISGWRATVAMLSSSPFRQRLIAAYWAKKCRARARAIAGS